MVVILTMWMILKTAMNIDFWLEKREQSSAGPVMGKL